MCLREQASKMPVNNGRTQRRILTAAAFLHSCSGTSAVSIRVFLPPTQFLSSASLSHVRLVLFICVPALSFLSRFSKKIFCISLCPLPLSCQSPETTDSAICLAFFFSPHSLKSESLYSLVLQKPLLMRWPGRTGQLLSEQIFSPLHTALFISVSRLLDIASGSVGPIRS